MTTDDCFGNDADIEQAALETAGCAAGRAMKRMRAYRNAGQLAEGAAVCPHGSGYPTDSPAASQDQDTRVGQIGFRCTGCGSWFAGRIRHLSDLRGRTADAPCELAPPAVHRSTAAVIPAHASRAFTNRHEDWTS